MVMLKVVGLKVVRIETLVGQIHTKQHNYDISHFALSAAATNRATVTFPFVIAFCATHHATLASDG